MNNEVKSDKSEKLRDEQLNDVVAGSAESRLWGPVRARLSREEMRILEIERENMEEKRIIDFTLF
ncbi:MAG TPA: hypothetical protein DG414_06665 [Gammaproteobacteria bacterium]|jgi:hypothetical protein|nr:hypothetical protein [Gammaproteobacteria bacterium]